MPPRRNYRLWFYYILVVVVILVVIVMGRWLNYKVLFQPQEKMIWTPDQETYEDLYLLQDDESGRCCRRSKKKRGRKYINVWFFEPFDNEKIVLYCHGNNDNNSYRDYVVDICRRFHLNLLLVDYRGYGRSDGRPTSEGVVNDAKSAYAFLRSKYDYDDIIVWGESLGGSAAIRIAAERSCHKLILLSTFASLPDIVGNMDIHRLAQNSCRALSWLLWDNIVSKDWIYKVDCPVAVIHSEDDDLIPYRNAKILYHNIKHDDKVFIKIKGAHSVPLFTRDDLLEIHRFIHSDESSNPDTSDLDNIISRIQGY